MFKMSGFQGKISGSVYQHSVCSGPNRLEFRFKSPVVFAQEEYDRQTKDHVVPPSCVPNQYQVNNKCVFLKYYSIYF